MDHQAATFDPLEQRGVKIKHHFSDDTYAKEMLIDAGVILGKHVHQYSHLSILAYGEADRIRPEVLEAFDGIMKAVRNSEFYKRSQHLDQTRSKDYWSTPEEMAARAFEAYLITKAAERGESNDYLANIVSEEAHQVSNEMFGEEPYAYPTKAEQETINAAFDKLFQTLQTKETDKGIALFSADRYSPDAFSARWADGDVQIMRRGLADEVAAPIVSKVNAKLKNGWSVKVVRSVSEVPQLARSLSDNSGRIEGAYLNGDTAYVVLNGIDTTERLETVIQHELSHLAAERVLSGDEYARTVKNIMLMEQTGNTTIKRLAAEVDARQPGLSKTNRAKEIFAMAVETGAHEKLPTLKRLWADVVRAFKTLLRAAGVKAEWLDRMGDAEVMSTIRAAMRGLYHETQPDNAVQVAFSALYSKLKPALDSALKAWSEIVDAHVAGTLPRRANYSLLPSTPASMQVIGLPDKPVVMKGMHALDYIGDRISADAIKQLPREIADPALIYFYEGVDGRSSLNFVTGMMNDGKHIVVALQPNLHQIGSGLGHYVATVMDMPSHKINAIVRGGGTMYVGNLDAVVGMKRAFMEAKRENGREAVNVRELASQRFSLLPTVGTNIKFKSDAVKLMDSGKAMYSSSESVVSGNMSPDAKDIRSIWGRNGQANREYFGLEPSQRASDDAQHSIDSRSSDELRNRAASASAERGRRILSKAESKPANSEGVDSPSNDGALFSAAPTHPLDLQAVDSQPAATTIPEETSLEARQREVQDKMVRFKVLQAWLKHKGITLSEKANVHEMENLMHSKVANSTEDFRNNVEAPLLEETARGGFSLDAVAEYLEAQHIPEANAQIRRIHNDDSATANGTTDEEAKQIIAKYEAMPQFEAFKSLADRWRAIGEDTLSMRLKEGLISQDQYDAYKATYKHWVPLRGDGKARRQSVGKGLSVNTKEKRRLGHGVREDGEYVLENLLLDRERAIYQIEHNRVVKSIIQFALEAKEPGLITVNKPEKRQVLKNQSVYEVQHKGKMVRSFQREADANAFINQSVAMSAAGSGMTRGDFAIRESTDPMVVMQASPMLAENEIQGYVAGHVIRIQLNDPLLARAATNMGVDRLNMLLSGARQVNNALSRIYTAYSPDFILRNAIRDFVAGAINLTGDHGVQMAAKIYANYPRAIKELFIARNDPNKSAMVRAYRAAGGNTGAAYLSDIERVGNDARQAMYERMKGIEAYRTEYNRLVGMGRSKAWASSVAGMKFMAAKAGSIPIAGHFLTLIEHLNAVTENALRLATYTTLKDNGYSNQKAAIAAKNSTINFNRKGEISNVAGSLYLFFNPAVQGSSRMFGTLLKSEHKAQAAALAGMLSMASFAMAQLGRGGDDDDDDEMKWKNTPDYIKDHNLVMKFGDLQWTIPVPYEFAPFHVLGNSISDVMHGESAWKASVKVLASLVDNVLPFGDPFTGDGNDGVNVFQVLPTIPKMVMAPHENQNSFGAPIQPEKGTWEQNKPDSQNMFRNTKGTVYSGAAEWMNEATGGSKYTAGAIDVSPETLKYWVSTITGGAGRFVTDSIGAAYNGVAEGVAPDLKDTPIVRVIVREPRVSDARQRFWREAGEVKAAADAIAAAKKAHDTSAVKELRESDEGDIARLAKFADKMGKLASKKRNLIDQIRQDESIPLARKREMMRQIEEEEGRAYDRFLRMFDQRKSQNHAA